MLYAYAIQLQPFECDLLDVGPHWKELQLLLMITACVLDFHTNPFQQFYFKIQSRSKT